jgi:hypothetical protein
LQGVREVKGTPEAAAKMVSIGKKRIGMPGYAAILGSLRYGALSTTQLANKHGVSRLLIMAVMRHCLRAGVVHRTDWHRPVPHARMVPRWALGQAGDISMPQYEEKTRRPRPGPSALRTLTAVLQVAAEAAHTRQELVDEVGVHIATMERAVRLLRDNGLLYIESWHKPPQGTTVAELRAGCKRDAPRPARQGKAPAVFAQFRQRREQMALQQMLAGQTVQLLPPAFGGRSAA